MRKLTATLLTAAALVALTAGQARAAAPQAADRACLGNFHSTAAQALGGVGDVAVFLARNFHPLGQTVSYEATTCDILFD
jgi:hypothetical protein